MLELYCIMACALNEIVYDTQLEVMSQSDARDAIHDQLSPQDTNSTVKCISFSAKFCGKCAVFNLQHPQVAGELRVYFSVYMIEMNFMMSN